MIDIIIVGHGIAGCNLAHLAERRGLSFCVIDEGGQSTSKVAVGMINPITGRKYVKTWQADRLWPFLEDHYALLEKDLNEPLFHAHPLFKVLPDIDALNTWQMRLGDQTYHKYLQDNQHSHFEGINIAQPHGGFYINKAYRVDGLALLDASVRRWISRGFYHKEVFDVSDLTYDKDSIQYRSLRAKYIVFCQGHSIASNPFFPDIPVRANKGEALIIESKSLPREVIIGHQVNIVPLGNQRYWVGSTYAWEDETTSPTDAGKEGLLNRLAKSFQGEYRVVDHLAGLRPASKDRRPIIGRSSKSSQVACLTGMGTKGYSLSPYFADMLLDALINQKDIVPEVNLTRFA